MVSKPTEEQTQRLWKLGELLTEEVRQAPHHILTGAILGQRARSHDPTLLSVTGLKLAEVLDAYAPELTVVGRSGVDLQWGLALSSDAPSPAAAGAFGVPNTDWPSPDGAHWTKVHLKNYRSIQDVEFHLSPLTVLVGRNGVGKSNLLDGIFRLGLISSRKPTAVFAGRNLPERVAGRWTPEAGFSMEAIASNGWRFLYESGNPYEPSLQPPFQVDVPSRNSVQMWSLAFTPLGQIFGAVTRLHLDANQLSRRTYSLDERPFLHHDGLGLGPVLAAIAQTDRERFARIVHDVRIIVPRVEDIRTDRQTVQTPQDGLQITNGVEVKMTGVGWIPADQLSEGTLLTIGLHTILSSSPPPRILLLDDIDRGLHPAAQRALIEQLMTISSTHCQIVCTSHSPYVLDPLPAQAVSIVTAGEQGETLVHPLVSHSDWDEWSGSMTPAEFWQYAGDETWTRTEVA